MSGPAPLLLLCLAALACGERVSGLPASGSVADSAGVAIWTIPAEDVAAPFRLERVGPMAFPDSGWNVWPDGVAVDPAGRRIYVLDESAPRILAFGFDGTLRGEIGREGRGPGEFVGPLALSTNTDGTLHVLDPGAGRVHTWSSDGAFTGSYEVRADYWGPGFEATPGGTILTTTGDVEQNATTDALVLVGTAGVDTLHRVQIHWTTLDMPCGRMPVPEVFYRSNVWAARRDLVAFAAVPDYRVELLEDGRPVASFRRATPPRRTTEAEAEASVPTGPLQFLVEGCGMKPPAIVADAGFVEEVSPIFALTLDPLGRLWAARGAFPDAERIDVLDPDAGYVGSVSSPAFPVAFLDASRLLTIVDGDWGSRLEIWRIVPRD